MCDGQYRPMQNYLRDQPDNIKRVNLVSETCTFISSFCVDITRDNIQLISSVLQTLIEMSVVSQSDMCTHLYIYLKINLISVITGKLYKPRSSLQSPDNRHY